MDQLKTLAFRFGGTPPKQRPKQWYVWSQQTRGMLIFMKIVLVILISAGLIFMNFPMSVAQEMQDACSQAKIDARSDIVKQCGY